MSVRRLGRLTRMSDARMLMVEACQGRFEFVVVGEAVEFRCKSHGAEHAVSGAEIAMLGTRSGL